MGRTHVVDDDRSGTAARTVTSDGARGALRLRGAVARMRQELAAYPRELPDRGVAQDELDELDALARRAPVVGPQGLPDIEGLRHALLLVAAALGSVSALAEPLAALRQAVEEMAPPR